MTHLLREKKADVSTMSAFFFSAWNGTKAPFFRSTDIPSPPGRYGMKIAFFGTAPPGTSFPEKTDLSPYARS